MLAWCELTLFGERVEGSEPSTAFYHRLFIARCHCVGGIANNSGGALVKRGPAYTELAIYAQVDKQGQLHLVNHLGIEGLGETPEEILTNLQEGNFDPAKIIHDERMASDREYDERVRDVTSDIPSRFNADERRLFEASGCAGKLGVFAVRVDSYPVPEKEQVFFTLAPMTLRN